MGIVRVLLMLILFVLPLSGFSGTGSGQVGRLYVHQPDNFYSTSTEGVVMFSVTQHLNAPACSMPEWAFSLDTANGRAMYALLLLAKAQGKSVTVEGSNDCAAWSDRERPHYLFLE